MLTDVTPQWLRGMFSRIAPRYDLTNTVISAGLDQVWRRRLAQCVARHASPEGPGCGLWHRRCHGAAGTVLPSDYMPDWGSISPRPCCA